MLPLVDIYTLVGSENKKPIAYALAYGLASQLSTKVTLIDSGAQISVENPYSNLKIIPARNLNSPIDSLYVLNQLVKNYDENKIFVINAPYEYLEDLMIANERVSLTKTLFQAIGLLKSDYLHNLTERINNSIRPEEFNNKYAKIGLTNLKKTLSFFSKLFSDHYESNAQFIKDEQRIIKKTLPLLKEFGVPDGLNKKDAEALKQGWIRKAAPLDEITMNSLIIPVITGSTIDEFKKSIAIAMYNEELSYNNNLLPYNILIDTIKNPTRKYLITQKNQLTELLLKTQIDNNEYETTTIKTKNDYNTETLNNMGQQLVNKESLKKLTGTKTFITKKE